MVLVPGLWVDGLGRLADLVPDMAPPVSADARATEDMVCVFCFLLLFLAHYCAFYVHAPVDMRACACECCDVAWLFDI